VCVSRKKERRAHGGDRKERYGVRERVYMKRDLN